MEHVVRCADPSLNIAHHSHARAQVVTSLQRGVPTILMYRHPADAIASLYAHQGGGSIASSLKDFLAFYSGTTKPHPCLIRVSFEDATQRPERVLAALATEFGIGKQTGMNSDQIVHAMDQSALKRRGHRKSSAVPNIDDLQRRALKEEAYHLLAQPAAEPLLARCMQLYEELSSDV